MVSTQKSSYLIIQQVKIFLVYVKGLGKSEFVSSIKVQGKTYPSYISQELNKRITQKDEKHKMWGQL